MPPLDRELKRGTLEMLLLRILADEPTYGYELLNRLGRRSAGRFEIKEGTLYPVLYRLEDAGLVVPEWEQRSRGVPRKIYRLTDSGAERLIELSNAWADFSAAISAVMTDPETGAKPEEEER